MEINKVRAAVEAAVWKAGQKFRDSYADERIVDEAVADVMAMINEHASDEYSRGAADGRFTESFYGASGDF
jgi:hypothetical protein